MNILSVALIVVSAAWSLYELSRFTVVKNKNSQADLSDMVFFFQVKSNIKFIIGWFALGNILLFSVPRWLPISETLLTLYAIGWCGLIVIVPIIFLYEPDEYEIPEDNSWRMLGTLTFSLVCFLMYGLPLSILIIVVAVPLIILYFLLDALAYGTYWLASKALRQKPLEWWGLNYPEKQVSLQMMVIVLILIYVLVERPTIGMLMVVLISYSILALILTYICRDTPQPGPSEQNIQ